MTDKANESAQAETGTQSPRIKSSSGSGAQLQAFGKHLHESILRLQGLTTVRVEHNAKLPSRTNDSEGRPIMFPMDIYWQFELDGKTYRALIHTTDWSRPLGLGTVLTLKAIVDDLPEAHKAVALTVAGFQKSAFDFAAAHGIELCMLRPARADEPEAEAQDILLSVTGYVPSIDKIQLQMDKDWLGSPKALPEGEQVNLLSAPPEQIMLYAENGRPIASMKQALEALVPRNPKGTEAVPVRKSFARPTYLHTDNPDMPKLKLAGVEGVVSFQALEQRYTRSSVLTQLLRAITHENAYAVDGALKVRRCDSGETSASAAPLVAGTGA